MIIPSLYINVGIILPYRIRIVDVLQDLSGMLLISVKYLLVSVFIKH